MKTITRKFLFPVLAITGGAFLSCTKSEPDPTIVILSPLNGATISDTVIVRYRTTNFASGHVHVDTDVSRAAGGTGHAMTPEAGVDSAILNLAYPGTHYIVVNGSTEAHVEIHSMHDSISVTHP